LKTGDRTRKKFSLERKKTNEQIKNGDRKIKEKKCRRSKKKTQ